MTRPANSSEAMQLGQPKAEAPADAGERLQPTLVAPLPRSGGARHSPLELWHLLSLDAPTVAALWTMFIARCAAVTLPATGPVAMFLAVWLLYAADRLLDARPTANGNPPADLEERHRFHYRHRRAFLGAIVAAALVLASLLHLLYPPALHLYAVLGVLLGAWLLVVHVRTPSAASYRLPKELAVGVFFAAAVFIPTVARAPSLRLPLLPPALLLAAVCTLNCLFLYAWEHPGPRRHAHWTTRWSTQHLPLLASLVLAAAAIAALRAFPLQAGGSLAGLPASAIALSAALLMLLHGQRKRLAPTRLRAAADAALLTPLLVLALLRATQP